MKSLPLTTGICGDPGSHTVAVLKLCIYGAAIMPILRQHNLTFPSVIKIRPAYLQPYLPVVFSHTTIAAPFSFPFSLLILYQPMTPFGVVRFWPHVISWCNPF